jgi:uncharacterized protein YdhG (YjbR/CyaY superfamily)
MPNRPDDVTRHLADFPPKQRRALTSTRASILKLLPGADEVIAWGMPSYRIDGDLVLSFSGFSDHNSLFPGAGVIEQMREEFPRFPTTKGTLHLPRDTSPPASILRAVIQARIAEINAGYPKASGLAKAFYDNGYLKHRGRMKDGHMHGEWVFYRRDGSRLRSGRFVRGEQSGLWTTYDRQGNPHRVTDLGTS